MALLLSPSDCDPGAPAGSLSPELKLRTSTRGRSQSPPVFGGIARAVSLLLLSARVASGDEELSSKPAEEKWNAHWQATVIPQGHGDFTSPYAGGNSLAPHGEIGTSFTTTLFLGARLWPGGEIYFDPEVSGGRGLSGVTGIAGFPNGEITRVTSPEPKVYAARLFLRHTFALGGVAEALESGQNQLAGTRAGSRLTVTFGKLSATDLFDDNAYSHDPRTQFLNWALMDDGAWDYPADTRGYTWGGTIEYRLSNWAVRYGVFAEPKTANGLQFDHNFNHAQGHALEWEGRYNVRDRPGKVRLLGYWNRANMGRYRTTLDTPAYALDIAKSRAYSSKFGLGLNVEQELTRDLGAFLRLGWDDGRTETWAFTEIDRTASLGLNLRGNAWHRPDDQFGIAGVVNGLSNDHRDYLAAGGYGFIVGDGKLNYAPEEIIEVYYSAKIFWRVSATADYQFVTHPAYNQDRGPVSIWALRFHAEF